MSLIGTLPNLEILKLGHYSFLGKIWDTKDHEFQKLKYLQLELPDLEDWNSSYDHFPVLERLVLMNCIVLKAIPFEFSKISTLQEIVVDCCGKNVETSALEIQQEQRDLVCRIPPQPLDDPNPLQTEALLEELLLSASADHHHHHYIMISDSSLQTTMPVITLMPASVFIFN
ncbi:Hypothetical predicted protein [Olea europaea subsp. europaea]|uniref:Uncharacterized protein n=1 Tax=Olea europaea subsp. europaea TaxID=158383 RepID=A0A8S0SIE2_OLEEU|nr:Hypothetical predicted protein [Olea europaea subsp. europaea]